MLSSFGGYDGFSRLMASGEWDTLSTDEKKRIIDEMKRELDFHVKMACDLKKLVEALDEVIRLKALIASETKGT